MSDQPTDPEPQAAQGEADLDTRVSSAVLRLGELEGLPPAEHVAIYDGVHGALQDALADAARVSQGSTRSATEQVQLQGGPDPRR